MTEQNGETTYDIDRREKCFVREKLTYLLIYVTIGTFFAFRLSSHPCEATNRFMLVLKGFIQSCGTGRSTRSIVILFQSPMFLPPALWEAKR